MSKFTGNSLAVGISTGGDTDAVLITANLVKSVEITWTADTYESTGAGDTAKTYLAGHQDANAKLDMWDDTTKATLRTKFDGLASTDLVVIYPQGQTVGKPAIYLNGITTSQTLGISHDGVTPYTVSIQAMSATTEVLSS